MAILPVQAARISNSLRMNLAQRTIGKTQQSLVELQNQLATGKKLTVPSDNPAAASLAQQLRKILAQRDGYASNLQYAGSSLSAVDTTLGDLTDLLRQAQTTASANASSTVSADERSAAAVTIDAIYNQAISLGNSQFQGAYLFGGDRSTQAPFDGELGGVRFSGSETVLKNSYDDNTILPFMTNGNDVFGALSVRVKGMADLSPVAGLQTRLSDLSGALGQGVARGMIVLGDGTSSKMVDLSKADTLGNVIDTINKAAVGGITASMAADGKSLVLSGGPTDDITVTEMGGTTAADLGIATAVGGGVGLAVNGAGLAPRITALTRLADLRGGVGIDQSTGLVIGNGTKSVTINLSGASTVEDLLNAINSANVGARASINTAGNGIDVLNAVQGVAMTISENGGTTAADLGIRSFGSDTPLSQLNNGRGVGLVAGNDLEITRVDGTKFQVDIDGAKTVADVIAAINTADAGGGVIASFRATGNGIQLADSSAGAGVLTVRSLNYATAAADLGLDVVSSGGVLAGRDVASVEATGMFGNLGKLAAALRRNDQAGITAAAEGLQKDLDRVIRTRGGVGAQVQEIEARQQRMDDQNVATKSLLSTLEDTDYNEAITRFESLQTALQANLQTTGKMLNMSLLEFLQ